jgi:hypothetical protein
MHKIFLTLAIIVISCLFSNRVAAQSYRFAAGLRLSNSSPTLNSAISAKYFATERTAVEGLVSFGSRFGVGALLEIHNPLNRPGLSWFYGGGVYVGFQDKETYLGPTGVVGLDYTFPSAPVNLSLDWKPELDIIPSVSFVPDAFAFSIRIAIK